MKMSHNEAHITLANNGHEKSIDCWCEPTNIRWITNIHGIQILVVEHNDEVLQHRVTIINNREAMQDWVSRVTTDAYKKATK